MKGYWRKPDQTAEIMLPGGWLRTGDGGSFDADGYLYLHDRLKDMLISGGENVYPAEVESVMTGLPRWRRSPSSVPRPAGASRLLRRSAAARCLGNRGGAHRLDSGAARALQVPGRRQLRHRASADRVGQAAQARHPRGAAAASLSGARRSQYGLLQVQFQVPVEEVDNPVDGLLLDLVRA